MDYIAAITKEHLKSELPVVNVGDTVRIHNRIKEGARERIQLFEGVVIAKHGGGISETFTVRRVSYSVGVEKTSPSILPTLLRSTSFVPVWSDVQSSTICVTEWARLPRLKRRSKLTCINKGHLDFGVSFIVSIDFSIPLCYNERKCSFERC